MKLIKLLKEGEEDRCLRLQREGRQYFMERSKKIKFLVDKYKYLLGYAETMGHRENFDQTDLAKFPPVYHT